MKKAKVFGILSILTFTILVFNNASIGSAMYQQTSNVSRTTENIYEALFPPETLNMVFLNNVSYDPSIKKDAKLKWKVQDYEKTDNFNIAEGDKNLKSGDTIILEIGTDPYLQLPNVESWCQIYVNDVMARYDPTSLQVLAVFKYFLPISLDFYENGVNYTEESYFFYLENSTAVNQSYWTFEDKKVTYNHTFTTEVNNVTDITIIFDRESGLMDQLFYSASFVNGTGYFAGVNFTLTRLHGWGLTYNISTLVIWIPLLLMVVALIVAIRLHLFQRFKLYLEARKIVRREE